MKSKPRQRIGSIADESLSRLRLCSTQLVLLQRVKFVMKAGRVVRNDLASH